MKTILKKRVMRRIYAEYAKNKIVNYADYVLPFGFLVAIVVSVSIPNVLVNMPKDNVSSALNFLFVAIRDTNALVQAALATTSLWACAFLSRMAYKISWKKIDFLRHWGLMRIRY